MTMHIDRMFFLACVILALSLGVSSAGPRFKPVSPETPETTFMDNVVIVTGDSPALRLGQDSSMGLPAKTWRIMGTDGALHLFSETGPNAILSLNSNGRVGIGTLSPGDALHIIQSANPGIRLEQSSPAQTWTLYSNGNGFFVQNNSAATFPFVVRSGAGDVGIGTTSPAGRLHVNGAGNQLSIFQSASNEAVQFRLQTNSTNRRFVALNTAGQQQSQFVFGDNGAFDFLGATAADVRMRLDASGNVGIGTTAPDQKLSVNGGASKPGGGSWATFSDERLKNIKGEFKSGLDEVMKLKPIRYEYKNDNAIGIRSSGEHIGFGAQEVQRIIPEAVTQNADGYLMIDNDPILWTMLNAIKEQNARINQLEEQNSALREQNADIAELREQVRNLQTNALRR